MNPRLINPRRATPAIVLAGLLAVGGCAGPTGVEDEDNFRLRTSHLNSEASLGALESDVKAEIEFGRELAARVLGQYGLYDNAAITRYVNLVGNAVAMHGQRDELQFRFAVLDSDEINAFAAPGGYVFVTRGALALMRDEAELAAVLAHEIAHVNQRHIVRELNIRGTEDSPESGLARMFGASADPARIAFNQALDKAIELLLSDGLKREDEFDADSVGMMSAAATGYDPTALARYLVRLKTHTGEDTERLHRTHPPINDRVAELNRLAREQQLVDLAPVVVRDRFEQYLSSL